MQTNIAKQQLLIQAKACDGKDPKEISDWLDEVDRLSSQNGCTHLEVAIQTFRGYVHKYIKELQKQGLDWDNTKFDCYDTKDISKFSSDEKPLINGLNFPLEWLNLRCSCSLLHFKSIDGKCISYTFSNAGTASTVKSIISEFHCFGNHTIPYALVNDLTADCPKANDEPIYQFIYQFISVEKYYIL